MRPLKVLDLFSGIGGFTLGLERTGGFETVAFCEIEEFPRRVLAKHWPTVPIYNDVRTLTAERLKQDGITADVICGGFPCQDISVAGKGAGITGERSGLWREYARIVGEVLPQYVIMENSPALLGRGLGVVLGDLAALGYDAEWHCVSAGNIGAPHLRDRIWIVAYANRDDGRRDAHGGGMGSGEEARAGQAEGPHGQRHRRGLGNGGEAANGANANGHGFQIGVDVDVAGAQASRGKQAGRAADGIPAQGDDGPDTERGQQPLGRMLGRMGGSTNPFRGTEIGRLRLNPRWVEELMGFPIGWTDAEPSATPSSRKSRKRSGEPS